MMLAEWVVYLLAAYAIAGLIFGVAFVSAAVDRIDADTKGTSLGFRLIILPGAAALWPILLTRLIRSRS